ncbi:hypothetical protein X797_007704 [Metarhizium robertsii]|uniref:Uncharacterized protein n=1 Tax=Metarhizium robertsii TaxID=568076 RepID=A0A014QXF6_9HYPO|nr:hypothetical protein X797_007704 [Metarhizium robertsii]
MYFQLCLALGVLLVQVSGQGSSRPVNCSAEGVVFDAEGGCCEPYNVRVHIWGLANEKHDLLCNDLPKLPKATSEDINSLGKCAGFNFDELSSACEIFGKPAAIQFTEWEKRFLAGMKGKDLLSKGFKKEDIKKLPKDRLGRINTFGVDFRKEFGIDFP